MQVFLISKLKGFLERVLLCLRDETWTTKKFSLVFPASPHERAGGHTEICAFSFLYNKAQSLPSCSNRSSKCF